MAAEAVGVNLYFRGVILRSLHNGRSPGCCERHVYHDGVAVK